MIPVINSIALPARPQPDTLIAIALLRLFGTEKFPGVENATIIILQDVMPNSEDTYTEQGILLIDAGGGKFDHHNKIPKTTASQLIADYLEISDRPALSKALAYAQRDDFFGRGTVSDDPLDRAFGLTALIAAVNKQFPLYPDYVAKVFLPLVESHIYEEIQKSEELPKEFENKKAKGETIEFETRQPGKKLKVIMIHSDSPSLVGYLRSSEGGRYDVILQQAASGHTNILTRRTKFVDLRTLAAHIRLKEAEKRNIHPSKIPEYDLTRPGQNRFIREWYYDRATNSIQNGGLNPQEVQPTKILWDEWKEILIKGLAMGYNQSTDSSLAKSSTDKIGTVRDTKIMENIK